MIKQLFEESAGVGRLHAIGIVQPFDRICIRRWESGAEEGAVVAAQRVRPDGDLTGAAAGPRRVRMGRARTRERDTPTLHAPAAM
jgi:hypothetical protein